MKPLRLDSVLLVTILLTSVAGTIAWSMLPTASPVVMEQSIELQPAGPGEISIGYALIRNQTDKVVRCIGCSSVCSFGCTGAVEIPFDIPPQQERSLRIEFHAPNVGLAKQRNGEIELTVFFDHIECREMKLTVKFSMVAVPAREMSALN